MSREINLLIELELEKTIPSLHQKFQNLMLYELGGIRVFPCYSGDSAEPTHSCSYLVKHGDFPSDGVERCESWQIGALKWEEPVNIEDVAPMVAQLAEVMSNA